MTGGTGNLLELGVGGGVVPTPAPVYEKNFSKKISKKIFKKFDFGSK